MQDEKSYFRFPNPWDAQNIWEEETCLYMFSPLKNQKYLQPMYKRIIWEKRKEEARL